MLSATAIVAGVVAVVPDSAATAAAPARQVQRAHGEASSIAKARAEAKARHKRVHVASQDTTTSTTYVNPDGMLSKVFTQQPTRVRRSGKLVAIDTRLHNSNGRLRPAAAPATVSLRSTATTARVAPQMRRAAVASSDADTPDVVNLDPAGPSNITMGFGSPLGSPEVTGSTATYALSSTSSLEVDTVPNGFVEDVLLDEAPTTAVSYDFPMTLGGGTTPKLEDGVIKFFDSNDKLVAQSRPLQMWDAQRDAGGDPTNVRNLHAALSKTEDGWTLSLTPDSTYLSDPSTVYPVRIDPSINLNGDDEVDSRGYDGNTTDYSTDYRLAVGAFTSGSTPWRSYINWNLGQIAGEDISSATMSLYEYEAGSCSPTTTRIYPTYTWSDRNTSKIGTNEDSAWYQSPSFNTGGSGCSSANGYVTMDMTKLVNGWESGELKQYGLQLRAGTSSAAEADPANSKRFCAGDLAPSGVTYCNSLSTAPKITVNYNERLGEQPQFPQLRHRLNDHSSLLVNTRRGNLSVQASDVHLGGRGMDLDVSRTYNSLDQTAGQMGTGWRLSTGADVYLKHGSTKDRWDYVAPGGTSWGRFVRKTDSGKTADFYTPMFGGLNVDLHDDDGGTYTMTFHQSQMKYVFDDLGCDTCDMPIKKIQDKNGNHIDFAYNGSKQLTSITDTHGRVLDVGRNTNGFISSISERTAYNANPRSWTYHYNDSNQLDYYIDPTGARTDYGYTSGLLTTITDPQQSSGVRPTTNLAYNSGQITTADYVTDDNGGTKRFTYSYNTSNSDAKAACNVSNDSWDFFTSVTNNSDSQGGTTRYCFKYRSQNPSPSDPHASDTNAPKLRIIDANGHHRSSDFDPSGSMASGTAQSNDGAASGSTVFGYNPNNTLKQATQPKDNSASTAGTNYFDYQATGGATFLPTSSYTSGGSCTASKYDAKGNMTDTYSGQAATSQNSTSCSGGTSGRHNHVEYNNDGTPNYAYGPNTTGAVTGDRTQYFYYTAEPNAGELLRVVRPGGNTSCTTDRKGCTSYVYDGLSRTTQVIDGKGQATRYVYDNDDRITNVMTNGATSCQPSAGTCVQYAYDGEGNLTSRQDVTGTTSFAYNRLNQQVTQNQPGRTITTSYDGAGNLTSYSQQIGNENADVVSYQYDGANQLTKIIDATGTYTVESDDDGRPSKLTLPSATGVSFEYQYTHSGKIDIIKPVGGSGLVKFDYNYDHSGKEKGTLKSVDRTVGSGAKNTTTYDYDSDDHLKTATPTSGTTYSYTYDANANLRSSKAGSSSTYYGYNLNDQLCWSGSTDNTSAAMAQSCATTPSGDTSYSSDAQGNNTGTTAGPLHYNPQNQVDQISSLTGAGPVTQSYSDQGNNLRLTAGNDSFTTGGPLGITSRTTGSNTSNTTYYTRTPTGQLVGEHGASGTYYYETDRQDSVIALVDGSGGAAATYSYTPFGGTSVTNGISTSAGQANPWRYTGGYQDPVDGYYKLGARYYDGSSHFTQSDSVAGSISRPEKFNGYTYTEGDPVNSSDLGGTSSFSFSASGCFIGICASISAGFDSDGDVNVGASLGAGGGAGFGANYDPDGNYTSGQLSPSVTAQCNAGPVNYSHDFVSGDNNTSLGTSEGYGCSASAGASYTF